MSTTELDPTVEPFRPSLGAIVGSPGITAATLIGAGVVAAVQGSLVESVLRALLVLVLVPCSVIDLDRRIIPNRITGPAALVAVALGLALNPPGEPGRLLWAAIAGGFLLLTALANPAGMGMGDVKLLFVMGLCLGRPVLVALVVALLASVVAAVAIAGRRGVRAARKTGLPFGPYLALGGVVAALAGNSLMHSYLSLMH